MYSKRWHMSVAFARIGRIALVLLSTAACLSAQRYSGHDHAVFHRPPAPPAAQKHPSTPAPGGVKAPPPSKQAPAPPTAQPAPRAQDRPASDLGETSAAPRSAQPVPNRPNL